MKRTKHLAVVAPSPPVLAGLLILAGGSADADTSGYHVANTQGRLTTSSLLVAPGVRTVDLLFEAHRRRLDTLSRWSPQLMTQCC